VTCDPDFKVMPLFNAEYLRLGVIHPANLCTTVHRSILQPRDIFIHFYTAHTFQ